MSRSRKAAAFDLLAFELAKGTTTRDAAPRVGISEQTAYRWWRDDPTLRARVAELRSGMVAQASGAMADAMTQAATTLRALLTAESETARLGAARSILEIGIKIHETVELEKRITDLEARAAASEESKTR